MMIWIHGRTFSTSGLLSHSRKFLFRSVRLAAKVFSTRALHLPLLHFSSEIAKFGLGLLELLIRVSWVQRREIVNIANPHGLDCAPEVFQTRTARLAII